MIKGLPLMIPVTICVSWKMIPSNMNTVMMIDVALFFTDGESR